MSAAAKPGARHFGAIALMLGLQAMSAEPALAQAAAPAPTPPPITFLDEEPADKDVFKFDFSVPTSPALTLLGVDNVQQANSLKPFVLALPDLLSSKETGQSAAIEFAPAWLLVRGDDRSYDHYNKGLRPLLFRTRLGAALYEGVKDSDPAKQKPSRAALGFSSSVLSDSDPLLAKLPGKWSLADGTDTAWLICLNPLLDAIADAVPAYVPTAAIRKLEDDIRALVDERERIDAELARNDITPERRQERSSRRAILLSEIATKQGELDTLEAALEEEAGRAYAQSAAAKAVVVCKRVADRAARVGSDLDLGGGVVWDGEAGKLSGFSHPTGVFWGSFRTSLGVTEPAGTSYQDLAAWVEKNDRWFMIGGYGRVGLSEAIATGDATKPKIRANTFTGWVGVERFTLDSRFALQIGLRRTDPRLAADSSFAGTRTVYQASFDQKMLDGIWLSVSYGRAEGTGALKDDSTARIRLVFTAPNARKIFGD